MQKRTVLNRLQKAAVDAIVLISDEQKHHALSYRSISMMTNYAQILPTFLRPHVEGYSEEQKAGTVRWLEWVQITLGAVDKGIPKRSTI